MIRKTEYEYGIKYYKTYHKTKEAAENHKAKIEKRGGYCLGPDETRTGFLLTYYFKKRK